MNDKGFVKRFFYRRGLAGGCFTLLGG